MSSFHILMNIPERVIPDLFEETKINQLLVAKNNINERYILQ